jgi:hypothetical protein
MIVSKCESHIGSEQNYANIHYKNYANIHYKKSEKGIGGIYKYIHIYIGICALVLWVLALSCFSFSFFLMLLMPGICLVMLQISQQVFLPFCFRSYAPLP